MRELLLLGGGGGGGSGGGGGGAATAAAAAAVLQPERTAAALERVGEADGVLQRAVAPLAARAAGGVRRVAEEHGAPEVVPGGQNAAGLGSAAWTRPCWRAAA